MVNLQQQKRLLRIEDVLSGYDATSQLYPYIPSISIWRAWEYAAYKRYTLLEPILDAGCGEGKFFHLAWPLARDIIGVDIDPSIVDAAKSSNVYRDVHLASARDLPFGPGSFASVFANCSLEHMDNLADVLKSIAGVLKPHGIFLLSVVTDKFPEWTTLPLLAESIIGQGKGRILKNDYLSFHHLVNALTPEAWAEQLDSAGFYIKEYVPIVPELSGRFFLFLDNLWHIKNANGAIGTVLHQYLREFPDFPTAFHDIIKGILLAEKDWHTCCGAVFFCRKSN